MRRISRSLAGVLVLGMACGLLGSLASCSHKEEVSSTPSKTTPSKAATPANASSDDAVLSAKGVTLDGKLIPVPCNEKEITAVLGVPSRKEAMPQGDTIFVWDDKGIIAYFRPGTDNGHAVDIVLSPGTYKFSPKSVFKHEVIVDGKSLAKGSQKSDIEAAGFKVVPPLTFLFQHKFATLECNLSMDPKLTEVVDVDLETSAAP